MKFPSESLKLTIEIAFVASQIRVLDKLNLSKPDETVSLRTEIELLTYRLAWEDVYTSKGPRKSSILMTAGLQETYEHDYKTITWDKWHPVVDWDYDGFNLENI